MKSQDRVLAYQKGYLKGVNVDFDYRHIGPEVSGLRKFADVFGAWVSG